MYTFYLSIQKKALVALKKQSSTNQTNQSGLKRSKCIQLTAGFIFFFDSITLVFLIIRL